MHEAKCGDGNHTLFMHLCIMEGRSDRILTPPYIEPFTVRPNIKGT